MAKSNSPSTASRRMSEIGDESKQRLMDAAEELFLEKGFENTTVVEIGQRAGISHGSIPWHFGNKSGLLYAIVVRMFDKSSSKEPFVTGQDGFNRLWSEQTYFDTSPKFRLYGAYFASEWDLSPAQFDDMLQRHVNRRNLVADWLRRSVEADSLSPQLPIDEIAEFWLAATRGLSLMKLTLFDNFDLPSARRALGVAVQSLIGCHYFDNFDKSL